ncbi:S8 family serine peptidase [Aliikangiella sp. G2MR2-5]|uniref:S8 family serine peptidase n=1 Tax=Aliikangiella sp. G2MR2-5 TaxID=2788943 RepID=UPI0018A99E17|nr:S8 family serine peptidase [Aliikangiella sp. G2MR2-5]
MKSKIALVTAATLLALGANAEAANKERVIVKFSPGKGQLVKSLAKKAGGQIKVDLQKHDAFAMEVPSSALNGLRNNPNIEYIEADAKRKLLSTNLNATELEPWGISRVQGDIVSDSLAGNRNVCIIDSGYDIRHSDLSGNVVSGTSDSGTGDWSTPGGSHGTHVAGTIAAINNGSGVVGVMPNGNVNLHIIKVFNESGWGYSSSLVSAVDNCVNAGANVISMSLGGGRSSRTEKNAFSNYYGQGVLSIAAAGNDGNTSHSYPASYDAVVSVAAVDSGNKHANFSQRTSQVELSGPGEAILSSVGLGDGQLAQLSVGGTDYFANGVVPHIFYNSSLSYDPRGNDGSASGELGVCTTTGTSYNCGDMTGKICLVERAENQQDDSSSTENKYPEFRGANACADAGAAGIVIYSNAARPGLQAPFMIDFNSKIAGIPTASIDRATGLAIAAKAGQSASLSKSGNQDWEYYNGTSMATPHVSAVAALVWSHHNTCSASEVRNALKATAEDLDAAGRDDKTGYGLVKAQAAIDYLTANGCTGSNDGGSGGTCKGGPKKCG